ncbi:HNH endonuclease signature motif containing protein [Stenotrophomonas sp. HITSZ_GD]|uniref:HNH endonuclease signature motif containing protein n=1 Tax=Stenotrophomonas sp. HITSZ_GD TaxID=3037248 RepID=UPI00240D5DED|nr:HNH endonuclease signature motif containing protein [Stenotrophomonas sp. HITSZ_GD]MDG2526212.1 HNH endonuclease signature motif containing protein [Stenotrophomonas sp. HITSZ_GD]
MSWPAGAQHPYRGAETDVTANGLPLRADIHTLFDLYLISVAPRRVRCAFAPRLAGTAYAEFRCVTLRNPSGSQHAVSRAELAWHKAQCASLRFGARSVGLFLLTRACPLGRQSATKSGSD